MRLTLVDGWKQAWRFHTVILAAALGALNWIADHPDLFGPDLAAALATVLPPNVMAAINRWVPLALIVVRLIKQETPARGADPAPAAPAPPPQP